MLIGSIPAKFPIPWANSATGGFIRPIPTASQIGVQAGAASLTDGFPPACFLPIGAGGTPPFGSDFNGILNEVTAWNQFQQAGGQVPYDSTFQGQINGYPLGAIVMSATTAGVSWCSTVDGNTSNPDTGGAGWQQVSFGAGGTLSTGDMKFRATTETLAGFVKANATTIGNASSNATQRANADALALFQWHWLNFSNTQCPVFTSGGAPTTRGASSAADFAANKAIQVLDWRGIGPLGMDTMGGAPTTRLSGVPVTTGSATQAGSVLGEWFHALLIAELAAHAHGINDPTHAHGINDPSHNHAVITSTYGFQAGTSGAHQASDLGSSGNNFPTGQQATGITVQANSTGITVQNQGSGTAHNTVQTSMTVTWYLKLVWATLAVLSAVQVGANFS